MSVLICSINELNRKAITDSINEAQKILGSKATGHNTFFPSLICTNCQSKEKRFFIEHACFRQQGVGCWSEEFEIRSDPAGNFTITGSEAFANNTALNQINIINNLLNNLQMLRPSPDIDIINESILIEEDVEIICICGHNEFNKGI